MADVQELDSFPKIVADCFIPLGRACKPAGWLKEWNLRYCSLPFDWLMCYPLGTVLNCIQGKAALFQECKEILSKKGKNRYVMDVKNQIASMHDFPIDKSVENYQPVFLAQIERRCKRLQRILNTYDNICFLCDRTENILSFVGFCSKLTSLYPQLTINFINIRHSPNEKILFHRVNDHVVVYDICADDIHKDGNDRKSNPMYWKGNEKLWNQICSNFSLSEKVKHQLIDDQNIDSFLKSE